MDRRVVSVQQRIDYLEAKAKTIIDDSELQAQLARFLCVLASGLIEQALSVTLENHVRKRSHPRVANYATHYLSRLHNAKFKDILTVLERFDKVWRDRFESVTDMQVRDAIDSLVNNRNQIAHGGQVGVSLASFSQYYKSLKVFIGDLDEFIASQ